MEGETVGVRDPLGVLDGVGDPLGVLEWLGVKVGVLEKEPPAVGVPDSVADRVVVPDGVEDLVVLLVPSFPESQWSVHSIVRLLQSPLAVSVTIEPSRVLGVNAVGVADFRMAVFSSWQQMIPLAWLIGAAGIALFHIGAFVQTLRRFKRSQVPASDALLNEVAALARDVGLRRSPRVCMTRGIRTPAVTGLLHPMLLLPVNIQETLSVGEMQFVLRHELTHIKRGDLPLNALLCVLLSLHWFNPVLWFAFFNKLQK
jgi:beta-lactamase regulating signal transducer with metallopeptidase domain